MWPRRVVSHTVCLSPNFKLPELTLSPVRGLIQYMVSSCGTCEIHPISASCFSVFCVCEIERECVSVCVYVCVSVLCNSEYDRYILLLRYPTKCQHREHSQHVIQLIWCMHFDFWVSDISYMVYH
jgi:hypothetical protein